MLLAIRLNIAASEPLRQSQTLDAVPAPLVHEPFWLCWSRHSSPGWPTLAWP